MSALLARIQKLAAEGALRVSAHGFEELANDDISLSELLDNLPHAACVEEYPDYHKGPCVLVLHFAGDGQAVHALWGTANSAPEVATLITAYRPDPSRWSADFMRRKPK